MRKETRIIMLVLIMMLAIGFAAGTSTIIIKNTAIFKANTDDFDIVFTKATIDSSDVSNSVISSDGKSISFTTSTLANAGDQSELIFEVTNNSTQYDASVELLCVADGANAGEYYSITTSIPDIIESLTTKSGNILVKLNKLSLEVISEVFTCSLYASAIEKKADSLSVDESNKSESNGDINNSNSNSSNNSNSILSWLDNDSDASLSIGDEVSIENEEFYVISVDDTKVEMLTKYNLNVGRIYENSTTYVEIVGTDGLQDSKMIAYPSNGGYPRYGTTIYGTNTAYEGSEVEKYVNDYSNYIATEYGIENTATLITIDQLDKLECSSENYSCLNTSHKWVYATSYWTRTSSNDYSVWALYSSGHFGDRQYSSADIFGVRPVVTISKNLF